MAQNQPDTDESQPEQREGRFPKSIRDLDFQNVRGVDARPSILGSTEKYRGGQAVFHVGPDPEDTESIPLSLDYQQVHQLAAVFQKMSDAIRVEEGEDGGE